MDCALGKLGETLAESALAAGRAASTGAKGAVLPLRRRKLKSTVTAVYRSVLLVLCDFSRVQGPSTPAAGRCSDARTALPALVKMMRNGFYL